MHYEGALLKFSPYPQTHTGTAYLHLIYLLKEYKFMHTLVESLLAFCYIDYHVYLCVLTLCMLLVYLL